MKTSSIRRGIAGFVSVLYFLTNALFLHAAETNIWSERRRAATRTETPDTTTVASLPSADPMTVLKGLPDIHAQVLSPTVLDQLKDDVPASILQRHTELLRAIPPAHGTIRRLSLPQGRDANLTVVFLQDVHNNDEAQNNLGKMVESLVSAPEGVRASLVALESAFAPLDLGKYRSFPDQTAVRMTADYLLKAHQITGPVHAACTLKGDLPPFVGVDDSAHYWANIEAYRRSAPLMVEAKYRLAVRVHSLTEAKKAIFNPELLSFDNAVQGYRDGSLPFGEYVRHLSAASQTAGGDMGVFLEALKMEKTLDFGKVERERTRLIEDVVRKLPKARIDQLLQISMAYRVGNLSHTDYYRALRELCAGNGVNLSEYPAMDQYIRYVMLSGRINAEKLFKALTAGEKAAYGRLARNDAEKALAEESRRASLTAKLLDFSLTPDEWAEYQASGAAITAANGTPIDLSSFEAFYKEADARNHAMTDNLMRFLSTGSQAAGKTAVVVAGGFHTTGMTHLLTERGVTVIEVAPKLTKVEGSASAYLGVFTQEKTPLEQIFKGNKLFVGDLAARAFSAGNQAAADLAEIAGHEAKSDTVVMESFDSVKEEPGKFENVKVTETHVEGTVVSADGRRVEVKINFDGSQVKGDIRQAMVVGAGERSVEAAQAGVDLALYSAATAAAGANLIVPGVPSKTSDVVSAAFEPIFGRTVPQAVGAMGKASKAGSMLWTAVAGAKAVQAPAPVIEQADSEDNTDSFRGKAYTDPKALPKHLVTGGVTTNLKARPGYVTFEQNGRALYNKDGDKLQFKLLRAGDIPQFVRDSLEKTANMIPVVNEHPDLSLFLLGVARSDSPFKVQIIRENPFITGFFDRKSGTLFISESASKDPVTFTHEVLEAFFGDNPASLPEGINSHTWTRGAGKDVREIARFIVLDGWDAERVIKLLKGPDILKKADGKTRQLSKSEENLIRFNGTKGLTGSDLFLGLQDRAAVVLDAVASKHFVPGFDMSKTGNLNILKKITPFLAPSGLANIFSAIRRGDSEGLESLFNDVETLVRDGINQGKISIDAHFEKYMVADILRLAVTIDDLINPKKDRPLNGDYIRNFSEQIEKMQRFPAAGFGLPSWPGAPAGKLRTPLSEISFSARVQNSFYAAGIKTLGELVKLSKLDLFKFKNLGRESLGEVQEVLAENGLHLADDLNFLLKKHVDTLGFSPSLVEDLLSAGVKTVGQLATTTRARLFDHGISRYGLKKVNEKLAAANVPSPDGPDSLLDREVSGLGFDAPTSEALLREGKNTLGQLIGTTGSHFSRQSLTRIRANLAEMGLSLPEDDSPIALAMPKFGMSPAETVDYVENQAPLGETASFQAELYRTTLQWTAGLSALTAALFGLAAQLSHASILHGFAPILTVALFSFLIFVPFVGRKSYQRQLDLFRDGHTFPGEDGRLMVGYFQFDWASKAWLLKSEDVTSDRGREILADYRARGDKVHAGLREGMSLDMFPSGALAGVASIDAFFAVAKLTGFTVSSVGASGLFFNLYVSILPVIGLAAVIGFLYSLKRHQKMSLDASQQAHLKENRPIAGNIALAMPKTEEVARRNVLKGAGLLAAAASGLLQAACFHNFDLTDAVVEDVPGLGVAEGLHPELLSFKNAAASVLPTDPALVSIAADTENGHPAVRVTVSGNSATANGAEFSGFPDPATGNGFAVQSVDGRLNVQEEIGFPDGSSQLAGRILNPGEWLTIGTDPTVLQSGGRSYDRITVKTKPTSYINNTDTQALPSASFRVLSLTDSNTPLAMPQKGAEVGDTATNEYVQSTAPDRETNRFAALFFGLTLVLSSVIAYLAARGVQGDFSSVFSVFAGSFLGAVVPVGLVVFAFVLSRFVGGHSVLVNGKAQVGFYQLLDQSDLTLDDLDVPAIKVVLGANLNRPGKWLLPTAMILGAGSAASAAKKLVSIAPEELLKHLNWAIDNASFSEDLLPGAVSSLSPAERRSRNKEFLREFLDQGIKPTEAKWVLRAAEKGSDKAKEVQGLLWRRGAKSHRYLLTHLALAWAIALVSGLIIPLFQHSSNWVSGIAIPIFVILAGVTGLRAWRGSLVSHSIWNNMRSPNAIAMAMPKGQEAAQPTRRNILAAAVSGLVMAACGTTGQGVRPSTPVSWDGFKFFATEDGISLEGVDLEAGHNVILRMNNHYAGYGVDLQYDVIYAALAFQSLATAKTLGRYDFSYGGSMDLPNGGDMAFLAQIHASGRWKDATDRLEALIRGKAGDVAAAGFRRGADWLEKALTVTATRPALRKATAQQVMALQVFLSSQGDISRNLYHRLMVIRNAQVLGQPLPDEVPPFLSEGSVQAFLDYYEQSEVLATASRIEEEMQMWKPGGYVRMVTPFILKVEQVLGLMWEASKEQLDKFVGALNALPDDQKRVVIMIVYGYSGYLQRGKVSDLLALMLVAKPEITDGVKEKTLKPFLDNYDERKFQELMDAIRKDTLKSDPALADEAWKSIRPVVEEIMKSRPAAQPSAGKPHASIEAGAASDVRLADQLRAPLLPAQAAARVGSIAPGRIIAGAKPREGAMVGEKVSPEYVQEEAPAAENKVFLNGFTPSIFALIFFFPRLLAESFFKDFSAPVSAATIFFGIFLIITLPLFFVSLQKFVNEHSLVLLEYEHDDDGTWVRKTVLPNSEDGLRVQESLKAGSPSYRSVRQPRFFKKRVVAYHEFQGRAWILKAADTESKEGQALRATLWAKGWRIFAPGLFLALGVGLAGFVSSIFLGSVLAIIISAFIHAFGIGAVEKIMLGQHQKENPPTAGNIAAAMPEGQAQPTRRGILGQVAAGLSALVMTACGAGSVAQVPVVAGQTTVQNLPEFPANIDAFAPSTDFLRMMGKGKYSRNRAKAILQTIEQSGDAEGMWTALAALSDLGSREKFKKHDFTGSYRPSIFALMPVFESLSYFEEGKLDAAENALVPYFRQAGGETAVEDFRRSIRQLKALGEVTRKLAAKNIVEFDHPKRLLDAFNKLPDGPVARALIGITMGSLMRHKVNVLPPEMALGFALKLELMLPQLASSRRNIDEEMVGQFLEQYDPAKTEEMLKDLEPIFREAFPKDFPNGLAPVWAPIKDLIEKEMKIRPVEQQKPSSVPGAQAPTGALTLPKTSAPQGVVATFLAQADAASVASPRIALAMPQSSNLKAGAFADADYVQLQAPIRETLNFDSGLSRTTALVAAVGSALSTAAGLVWFPQVTGLAGTLAAYLVFFLLVPATWMSWRLQMWLFVRGHRVFEGDRWKTAVYRYVETDFSPQDFDMPKLKEMVIRRILNPVSSAANPEEQEFWDAFAAATTGLEVARLSNFTLINLINRKLLGSNPLDRAMMKGQFKMAFDGVLTTAGRNSGPRWTLEVAQTPERERAIRRELREGGEVLHRPLYRGLQWSALLSAGFTVVVGGVTAFIAPTFLAYVPIAAGLVFLWSRKDLGPLLGLVTEEHIERNTPEIGKMALAMPVSASRTGGFGRMAALATSLTLTAACVTENHQAPTVLQEGGSQAVQATADGDPTTATAKPLAQDVGAFQPEGAVVKIDDTSEKFGDRPVIQVSATAGPGGEAGINFAKFEGDSLHDLNADGSMVYGIRADDGVSTIRASFFDGSGTEEKYRKSFAKGQVVVFTVTPARFNALFNAGQLRNVALVAENVTPGQVVKFSVFGLGRQRPAPGMTPMTPATVLDFASAGKDSGSHPAAPFTALLVRGETGLYYEPGKGAPRDGHETYTIASFADAGGYVTASYVSEKGALLFGPNGDTPAEVHILNPGEAAVTADVEIVSPGGTVRQDDKPLELLPNSQGYTTIMLDPAKLDKGFMQAVAGGTKEVHVKLTGLGTGAAAAEGLWQKPAPAQTGNSITPVKAAAGDKSLGEQATEVFGIQAGLKTESTNVETVSPNHAGPDTGIHEGFGAGVAEGPDTKDVVQTDGPVEFDVEVKDKQGNAPHFKVTIPSAGRWAIPLTPASLGTLVQGGKIGEVNTTLAPGQAATPFRSETNSAVKSGSSTGGMSTANSITPVKAAAGDKSIGEQATEVFGIQAGLKTESPNVETVSPNHGGPDTGIHQGFKDGVAVTGNTADVIETDGPEDFIIEVKDGQGNAPTFSVKVPGAGRWTIPLTPGTLGALVQGPIREVNETLAPGQAATPFRAETNSAAKSGSSTGGMSTGNSITPVKAAVGETSVGLQATQVFGIQAGLSTVSPGVESVNPNHAGPDTGLHEGYGTGVAVTAATEDIVDTDGPVNLVVEVKDEQGNAPTFNVPIPSAGRWAIPLTPGTLGALVQGPIREVNETLAPGQAATPFRAETNSAAKSGSSTGGMSTGNSITPVKAAVGETSVGLQATQVFGIQAGLSTVSPGVESVNPNHAGPDTGLHEGYGTGVAVTAATEDIVDTDGPVNLVVEVKDEQGNAPTFNVPIPSAGRWAIPLTPASLGTLVQGRMTEANTTLAPGQAAVPFRAETNSAAKSGSSAGGSSTGNSITPMAAAAGDVSLGLQASLIYGIDAGLSTVSTNLESVSPNHSGPDTGLHEEFGAAGVPETGTTKEVIRTNGAVTLMLEVKDSQKNSPKFKVTLPSAGRWTVPLTPATLGTLVQGNITQTNTTLAPGQAATVFEVETNSAAKAPFSVRFEGRKAVGAGLLTALVAAGIGMFFSTFGLQGLNLTDMALLLASVGAPLALTMSYAGRWREGSAKLDELRSKGLSRFNAANQLAIYRQSFEARGISVRQVGERLMAMIDGKPVTVRLPADASEFASLLERRRLAETNGAKDDIVMMPGLAGDLLDRVVLMELHRVSPVASFKAALPSLSEVKGLGLALIGAAGLAAVLQGLAAQGVQAASGLAPVVVIAAAAAGIGLYLSKFGSKVVDQVAVHAMGVPNGASMAGLSEGALEGGKVTIQAMTARDEAIQNGAPGIDLNLEYGVQSAQPQEAAPVNVAAVLNALARHAYMYGLSQFGEEFHARFRAAVAAGRVQPVDGNPVAANQVVTRALAHMGPAEVASAVAGSNVVTEDVVRNEADFVALEPALVRLHGESKKGGDIFVVPTGKEGEKLIAFIHAELLKLGLGQVPEAFEAMDLPVNAGDAPLQGTALEAPAQKHLADWSLTPANTRLILNLPEDLEWINDWSPNSPLSQFGLILAIYSALSYKAYPVKDVEQMERVIQAVVTYA